MIHNLLTKLFPKTVLSFIIRGYQDGVFKERERSNNERLKIKTFEMEELIGKRIIVISNEWTDPWIGAGVRLENFNSPGEPPFLVGKNSKTGEELIHFGKIIPFSFPILKTLCEMNPYDRWEMLTGQKTMSLPPSDVVLKTFEELTVGMDK